MVVAIVAAGCGGDDSGDEPAGGTSGGTAGTGAGSSGMGGDVDWTQLAIEPAVAYSAYDGEHTFQVPMRVEGITVALEDWSAEPASAVQIEADPVVEGGVMITVEEAVPMVTISARAMAIGGRATLHITEATSDQWALGEMRYKDAPELMLPTREDFSRDDAGQVYFMGEPIDIGGGNGPPSIFELPNDVSCNNCHTTGARYFEVQHTPRQVAAYSDEQLIEIFSNGQKPPGAEFKVLPSFLEPLYPAMHTWDASEEESMGIVIYLRSLEPTEQGDVNFPGAGGGLPGGGMR